MTGYSVHVATRNPAGGDPQADLPGVDDFADQLADLGGVVTAGGAGWSATVSFDDGRIDDVAGYALEAIIKAARNAGLPAWPVVRLEVLDHDELERDLARPTLPDMVSGPEAAEILDVTRQRLHQLRDKRDFPRPLIDRPGATLWARAAIERFAQTWERKPGRPPVHHEITISDTVGVTDQQVPTGQAAADEVQRRARTGRPTG